MDKKAGNEGTWSKPELKKGEVGVVTQSGFATVTDADGAS
jgi:hypothetical protein